MVSRPRIHLTCAYGTPTLTEKVPAGVLSNGAYQRQGTRWVHPAVPNLLSTNDFAASSSAGVYRDGWLR